MDNTNSSYDIELFIIRYGKYVIINQRDNNLLKGRPYIGCKITLKKPTRSFA